MTAAPGTEMPPDDAFTALANETRLRILRALVGTVRSNGDDGLSFSELRRRVGVRDAGQFNYHLDALRGHFVATDDDGYRLTYAGMKVVSALAAGTYTDTADPRSEPTDVDCPRCDERLTAVYADERYALECPTHGRVVVTPLPPGAATDRSMADLGALAGTRAWQYIERAREGACPECWGHVDVTFPAHASGDHPVALFECDRCWVGLSATAGMCVASHPAVVAFLHERGFEHGDRTGLHLPFVWSADAATLVSEEPVRVDVTVEYAGDALTLTLDGETRVVAVGQA